MIGYIAATLTTIAFLPQAIRVINTKNTAGISLIMYLMFVTAKLMWTIYGFILNDLPLIISNLITLFFASIVLIYVIIYPPATNKD